MEETTVKEFLETTPPGKEVVIKEFTSVSQRTHYILRPDLHLHCGTKQCEGIRFYESRKSNWVSIENYNNEYLTYLCRNCKRSLKTFSIRAKYVVDEKKWIVSKFGEKPAFGPPTPARAFNLIGGERDLFLLGRRNENQGMGIGAFVYYRRVIESQKIRIFDELIRVISKISPEDQVLAELELAKKETQFTKGVEAIKHALPQSLNINGYNPLTLLHSALSEGVHEHSDEECLELASSVRTVLFEFAERLGQALKEEAELNAAVNRLANQRKDS
ncbi:MAG: hypothetical protein R3F50_04645 [Gammaproteobacteria bacterium]